MMTRVFAGLIGGALMATATLAGAQTPEPAKAAAGKATFEETKCSKCHGAEGKGDAKGNLSLVGVANKLSDAQIRSWITDPATNTAKLPKKPKEAMKKFDLTPAQVDGLVAYVQSLKK
jgi:mono/diheme cytochrome c family protein